MTPELRGPCKESNEVEPVGRNKVERDAMYTPTEKKKLKPDKNCQIMYAVTNSEARKVVNRLSDLYHVLQPCDLTADSLYEAILYQVSHKADKYKPFQLRKQIAYYLIKYPEVFYELSKKHIDETEESYESFVWNIFYGLSFPKLDITTAVIARMWNLSITLVTPRGIYRMYHKMKPKKSDIIVVWNGCTGLESQFTATKGDRDDWRPIKGLDWAGDVKQLSNVKNASAIAERFYRKRTAQSIMNEYNEVTNSILDMKEQLVNMNSEINEFQMKIDSMKHKMYTWASNVYKMEGRQGVLRLQLIELGVDIDKLAEGGSVVPGFQTFLTPEEKLPAKKRKPTSTVTNPEHEQLGAPPDFTTENQVHIDAEVHQESSNLDLEQVLEQSEDGATAQATPQSTAPPQSTTTPQSSTTPQSTATTKLTSTGPPLIVTKVVTPDLSVVKTIHGDTPRRQHPLWSTPRTPQPIVSPAVQSTPLTQQMALQLTASAAQQIQVPVTQAIQLPIRPETFNTSHGAISVRWGKTLKGVHKYFCHRCSEPFTTKNDCTRHEDENCPQLPKDQRKKYTCEHCSAQKSSKQYLREHIAEEHTKQYIYFCKGCRKGFYKHTALNFHKKNCLTYLVPPLQNPLDQ